MKPFWFAFNVTDWLSSKSVRMMSLAERGAYIGLLATAWGEDVPGTLPVADELVRRLAEMPAAEWAISGPILLAEFPVSECGTFRYNPRLREEHAKQVVISEKNSAKGKLSAERRAAKGQPTSNRKPTAVESEPTAVENSATESQLVTTTVTTTSSNEEKASRQREADSSSSTTSPATEEQGGAARPKEYRYDEAPVFLSKGFNAFLDKIGYSHVNKALYLLRISDGAKKAVEKKKLAELAPNADWETFIQRWLDNDYRKGALLLPPPEVVPAQQAFRPQERITGNPQATVAGGDLNGRIQAQQNQKFVL